MIEEEAGRDHDPALQEVAAAVHVKRQLRRCFRPFPP